MDSNTLLIREASLAAMSLGVGLTHIRKYDFSQTGFFYNGLFSLTIGLERVLKLVLIYDYQLNNDGKFPTNKELKKFGHKLSDLLKLAEQVSEEQGLGLDKSDLNTTLSRKIIDFLTDFAVKARYYNLDSLTGKSQEGDEPLVRWDKEICSEIIKKHYRPTKKQAEKQAELEKLMQYMRSNTFVMMTGDDGVHISDPVTLLRKEAEVPTKSKYSMYYLCLIVRFACNVLIELEFKGNIYPHLREFFYLYTPEKRSDILNRKTWNPFPPFHL